MSAAARSGSLAAFSAALARGALQQFSQAQPPSSPRLWRGANRFDKQLGTARATEISFDSSVLSVASASMMTLRSKPRSSNRAANIARSI